MAVSLFVVLELATVITGLASLSLSKTVYCMYFVSLCMRYLHYPLGELSGWEVTFPIVPIRPKRGPWNLIPVVIKGGCMTVDCNAFGYGREKPSDGYVVHD